MDDCRPRAMAGLDVAVNRVVARVEHPSLEPAVEGGIRVVEHRLPGPDPGDLLGRFAPEPARIGQRSRVDPIEQIRSVLAHDPLTNPCCLRCATPSKTWVLLNSSNRPSPARGRTLASTAAISSRVMGVKSRTILRFWSSTFSESMPETSE